MQRRSCRADNAPPRRRRRSFHRDVNTKGPVIAGSPYASKNHAALFKFAPAGAPQTEPLLAAGGKPVAGNNTLTSVDTGSGVLQAVRARARACKAGCLFVDARAARFRPWRPTLWRRGWRCALRARCDK